LPLLAEINGASGHVGNVPVAGFIASEVADPDLLRPIFDQYLPDG
jgi:hypothetical protein